MADVLKILGPASALLLLALLAAGAPSTDMYITTAECTTRRVMWRVRRYPTDSEATILNMWNCGLTEIDQGYQLTFTGLPNLKTIELNHNHIENINPAAFHTVPTLTSLLLHNNKLRELPVFDERSCPNLTELILSRNQLTLIENERTFSACVKLIRLTLSENHIEFIHPNAFKQLTELEFLHLDNNKIRFIPDQMFVNNGKLEQLELNNNRFTDLPPNLASSLKRAGAYLRRFYFHDNPWHCACMLELLADVQRARVTFYKKAWDDHYIHYDGTQPECTYIGMYPCRRFSPSGLLTGH